MLYVKLAFWNYNAKNFEEFNIPVLPMPAMLTIAKLIVATNTGMRLAILNQKNGTVERLVTGKDARPAADGPEIETAGITDQQRKEFYDREYQG